MLLRTLTSGIDTNIRYMPILRELQRLGTYENLLEVGSGSEGIARYLNHRITGADIEFSEPIHPNLLPVQLTGTTLPFADDSFDVVVSTDMLEHVPPKDRPTAVAELARVCRRSLFLAVPVGKASEAHDKKIDALYLKKNGVRHPFLIEHVQYGLPDADDIKQTILSAFGARGKSAFIRQIKNYNLSVREWEARAWLNPSTVSQRLFSYSRVFSLFDSALSFGECYRVIFFVDLRPLRRQ